ncbi:MAG: hypothetical protein B1H11_04865 [Desulfobacteraceae bacterium 4484_190.1]|nr:MAG: hypothetical protein B1H11_04865 [Desulfobacteraceae bacterium 4484_190.1]
MQVLGSNKSVNYFYLKMKDAESIKANVLSYVGSQAIYLSSISVPCLRDKDEITSPGRFKVFVLLDRAKMA